MNFCALELQRLSLSLSHDDDLLELASCRSTLIQRIGSRCLDQLLDNGKPVTENAVLLSWSESKQ